MNDSGIDLTLFQKLDDCTSSFITDKDIFTKWSIRLKWFHYANPLTPHACTRDSRDAEPSAATPKAAIRSLTNMMQDYINICLPHPQLCMYTT